jgi:hypothetical protein
LVSARERGGKPIRAERRPAPRIQEHDIVGHQAQLAGQIAGVHCIDPRGVQFTDRSFITFHLPPPLKQFDSGANRAPVDLGRRLSKF